MTQRIRDVMTTPAVTAIEDSTIGAAIRLMHEEQLTSVPVVDEHGTLIGTMTCDVVAVRPDDELAAVVELMRSTATTTLPVVDGKRLVGTVTLEAVTGVLPDDAADPYHRRHAEVSACTAR